MSASVITRVDASPVLETAEHVLDFMALAIERPVVVDNDFAVPL